MLNIKLNIDMSITTSLCLNCYKFPHEKVLCLHFTELFLCDYCFQVCSIFIYLLRMKHDYIKYKCQHPQIFKDKSYDVIFGLMVKNNLNLFLSFNSDVQSKK
jgi:hypothetical protein